MQSPATVIAQLGSAATRQQLIAAGLSGYDLTIAVRRGEIIRCRQARYILPTTSREIAAAVRVGGRLGGPSAARSYGLWAGFDTRLHIVVGHNSSRLRTNYAPSFLPSTQILTPDRSDFPIVLHWLKNAKVPELAAETWRVSLGECLRQMVEWSDRETAIACLDTAMTTFRLSAAMLMAEFTREPVAHQVIAGSARRGSEAGTESLVRQRLNAEGVEVDQQVVVPGVGRIDIRVRGTRVLIEVDGYEYHSSRPKFEADRIRLAELVALRWIPIQLSYRQVVNDWPWCLRVIRAAIDQSA